MGDKQQILQIIPATGWCVKWKEWKGNPPSEEALACWALVEVAEDDETSRQIEGIIFDDAGFQYICSEVVGFAGYVYKGGSAATGERDQLLPT